MYVYCLVIVEYYSHKAPSKHRLPRVPCKPATTSREVPLHSIQENENYLNKKRNKAILLENPTDNKFELGVKYEVYVGCCQVDYYINLNRSTRKCE